MDAVHIVGAGGIGCAVGYALSVAGVAVTFVEADPEKVAWGREHGVGLHQGTIQRATFGPFAEWRPPRGVPVLLCTKCYDNAAVLARLPEDADLIPIQNGFDPALQARPPHVEGIASFVSECLPHRPVTRITRGGTLHLGPSDGAAGAGLRERAEALAARVRRAPFRVEMVEDIRPYKYTKLMYNAAISPLAAAAGLHNGDLLRLPRARRLFFDLLRENYAILSGAGVILGKVGPLRPTKVAAVLRRPWLARALAWAFYPSLRGTYCSMAGDLPGRTEIDNYNGHLIALAGDRPCPLNRRVYDLVKRMERERVAPHPSVLGELLAAGAAVSV